ncbi:hypothetical protein Swol_0326 [Syntrophomonas wolfei subsp. wolfei str. Goettingen G311]|uniref:Uncharacterized protein n=1 Tax=Syntrophomonas wolfei subsp. wolfei (strain DSM 2245B / Goettingen) TaxID=335541 RepID=Q0B036_SYNWW|nr:hypothetical protein Swol_0326 [Syntrophomonas wolfei subsp. wolfei str. Goettingen G311]
MEATKASTLSPHPQRTICPFLACRASTLPGSLSGWFMVLLPRHRFIKIIKQKPENCQGSSWDDFLEMIVLFFARTFMLSGDDFRLLPGC